MAGGTPILDRLAPLPEPVHPRPAGGTAGVYLAAAGIVLLGVLAQHQSLSPLRRWGFRQIAQMFPPAPWGTGDFVVVAASIVSAMIAMVVIHEAGHLAGGVAAGFRFHYLRIGPLQVDRHRRLTHYRGPGGWLGGATAVVPVRADHLRVRAVVLILGGAAANLLTVLMCLWLPPSYFSRLLVMMSATTAVITLLPVRNGPLPFDGWHLLMMLKNRGWAERWLAIMRLAADVADGVPPESWPDDFLAKAIGVQDDSADTVRAHGLAHAAYDARGDREASALALETCLQYSSTIPPDLRESLICDAAVFQGRRRMREDLARQWLADLPDQPQFPALRPMAEAAVLQAQGDRQGAAAKLDEAEEHLRAVQDRAMRDAALREVRRWKCELAGPVAPATAELLSPTPTAARGRSPRRR